MSQQYWSPAKIESSIKGSETLYPLRIIAGPNRIGKTYGGVSMVCETVGKGENVLWMRMFDEEFKGEFIDNFINIMHEIDDTLKLEKCEGGIKVNGIQRVYFRSLNVFGKARGNGSTTGEVTLSILDEFIPEDGRVPRKGVYLPMMALIRTFSNYSENCICYCFGNCITPLSDLFASIQAFPAKGQDITLYPDKGVVIEVCRGYTGKIPDKGPWSKVVKAGAMRSYQEFDGLYIDDLILIPKHPIPTQTALKYNEREYLTLYNDNNKQVWCINSKPPTGVTPLSLDADIKCIFIDPHIKKEIRNMFFAGRYRFKNYNTLSRFLSLMALNID